MSTRFYAGQISSGMCRTWEDWIEPEPGIEAQLRRRRALIVRPHGPVPMRAAAPPDSPHHPVEPIAASR